MQDAAVGKAQAEHDLLTTRLVLYKCKRVSMGDPV
jgi:hypothetical protein